MPLFSLSRLHYLFTFLSFVPPPTLFSLSSKFPCFFLPPSSPFIYIFVYLVFFPLNTLYTTFQYVQHSRWCRFYLLRCDVVWLNLKVTFQEGSSTIIRTVLYHSLIILRFQLFDRNGRKNSYTVTWSLEHWKIIGHVPLILVTITGHYTEQDMSIPITCFDGNCKKTDLQLRFVWIICYIFNL